MFYHSFIFYFSSSDEEDADADYEDSEYESDSSDSELEEGCSNIKLAVPLHPLGGRRKKKCPHQKQISSTEQDSDSDDDDLTSSEDDSESSDDSLDDFSGSESNTECDFTDSEGRPNPFHKDLEVPRILIEPESPEVPGMRRYPEDIIEANTRNTTRNTSDNMNFSAARFQYKTPNLADDLAKKEKSMPSAHIGRSTQRQLNLKKNWVSDASMTGNNHKAAGVQKGDLDNRFKSLMDRLSNQQKLLKPADKPSTQMEHFMKRTSMNSTVKSVSTDPLITSPLMSPAVVFTRQTSDNNASASGPKFTYPPPYKPNMTNGISAGNIFESSNPSSCSHSKTENDIAEASKPVFYIEEKPEDVDDQKTQSSDQDLDKQVDDEKPPPIPPIPDIYIEEHKTQNVEEIKAKESIEKDTNPENEPNDSKCANSTETSNTTYESCNTDGNLEDTNDANYMTPANELSLNPEDLQGDNDIPLADDTHENVEPLATSSPAVVSTSQREPQEEPTKASKEDLSFASPDVGIRSPTESEKAFIQKCSDVKLNDDEIMRIYQERNPLERLAKFNSLKKKQSSVVHGMILSASANKPRTRRTRVAAPSSSIPPIPSELNDKRTPQPIRTRAATEPPMSLPATPLTDPAKFGIPVARNAKRTPPKKPVETVKTEKKATAPARLSSASDIDKLDGIISTSEDGFSGPNSPSKKANNNPATSNNQQNQKKTFMQTISGIFRGSSTTRIASPEESISSPPPTSNNAPNNNSTERKARSDFIKFLKPSSKKSPVSSPEAPRANLSEMSNEDDSSRSKSLMIRQSSKLSLKASHPSTPPVPLSRKITIIRHASDESLSENEDDITTGESTTSSLNIINGNGQLVPPEIMEKIMKRGGKSAKRAARIAHLKRVRKAQEIQRQLEELDVMHKELEERGIEAERSLRGEIDDENENPDLLQTWFILLAEKNALVRHEQELLVQAKQLELEDKSSKLEVELRDHLLLDSRSTESVGREAGILQDLLAIAEQREKLQSMLERDRKRYMKEDQDIEAQMKAKGLRVTPVRKLSLHMLDTSSTA